MAGREPSISRRRILGAAASVPFAAFAAPLPHATGAAADAALWRRRLAAYRRLAARAKAAAEVGWFRKANDLYARRCAEIAARFGSRKGRSADEQRLRAAAFARIDRAEELYWGRCTDPMQKAAIALACTPAPDLPALRAKIAVMRAHALEELDSMPRHPLELVDEDVARLERSA